MRPGASAARAGDRAGRRAASGDAVRDAAARALGLRAQAARRVRGTQALGAASDLDTDTFLRLSDNDAKLFQLLDGTRSLVDLIGFAEQRFGAAGPARLARLLADLGERGFLAGVARDAQRRGGRAADEPLAASGCSSRARRSFRGVGAVLIERALPARRLGAVHAPAR